ncbi:unnamed protein product [Brachionus calyciflorus]|uniref:Uncharacterized protein n=1 Tax=Brachionus calyciflorus TaxID=104777 RepID=A0A813ML03_9BILA|nr:unnamed protein product [Brachionus calyciflorus]
MPSSMSPPTTTNLQYDKRDGDMKSKNNFPHFHYQTHHHQSSSSTTTTTTNKSSSGRNKERETHHRYSYDLSSSSTKTTQNNQNTANGSNRPITTNKQQSTSKTNNNNNKTNSSTSQKDSNKYIDYENLLKQFEKLKLKAEFFADKDPEFAAKLINLANKITKTANYKNNSPKMENNYYPYYQQQSNLYSTHSSYPSSNIYSTFNSNNYSHFHYNNNQSHHAPPTNPPPPPPPRPPPIPPHRNPNNSAKFNEQKNFKTYANTNYPRYSYDNNSYTRSSNAQGSQGSFDHNIYTSQCFNYNYPTSDNTFAYSYAYAHERPEDLLLILEDPYDSSKITVQLTRTQMGPNGEQQRVTVERDFKSEAELNKFLKEFEENLNKTSPIPPSHQTPTKTPSFTSFFPNETCEDNDDLLKPGVVVVEEPGEEPKLYRQDTGELVTNGSFVDPLIKEENNEHPNLIPKQKEEQQPKYYKDIDDIFKVDDSQPIDPLNRTEKSSFSRSSSSQNNTSRDLINFDDDVILDAPKAEPELKSDYEIEPKSEPIRRTVRRAESFALPKAQTLSAKTCMTNKDLFKMRHRSSSTTTAPKPQTAEKPPIKPDTFKKSSSETIKIMPNSGSTQKEKSKIKVININKNCKRTASLSENSSNVPRIVKPTVEGKGKENELSKENETINPTNQFKHKFDKPLLSNHARLGGEPAVNLKRHTSLLYPKTSLPKSESSINYEETNRLNSQDKKDSSSLNEKPKKSEIKSRFSLRETRPSYTKDSVRRYSQIYQKETDSDISTIHEEKRDDDFETIGLSKTNNNLEEKKHKFIKNHRLMMSRKISKSVDTGLSESSNGKYIKVNKLDDKVGHKNNIDGKYKQMGESSIREEFNDTDSDDYETAEIVYEDDRAFKSSNKNLNYDFYKYDQVYPEGYYGSYYNSTATPTNTSAYFQPNFFTKPRVQEPDIATPCQTQTQQTTQQPTQGHNHYYQGYYASWYGSAPSLRVPTQRIDNCQSLFFN